MRAKSSKQRCPALCILEKDHCQQARNLNFAKKGFGSKLKICSKYVSIKLQVVQSDATKRITQMRFCWPLGNFPDFSEKKIAILDHIRSLLERFEETKLLKSKVT